MKGRNSLRRGLPAFLLVCGLLPASAQAQFTQQGPKLVGTGAVGTPEQGPVALSANGNTAIIGGPDDNNGIGAAWVFTRSGGVWSQQAKLVGTGAIGPARQGDSVALSGDGSTAIIGGYQDNGNIGAAWVFTRSGGVWSQQGPKLVGTGILSPFVPAQGLSVALSTDGNTAIIGGPYDGTHGGIAGGIGAAWVFTRSGGVWSQQGPKLVGTGAIGAPNQGTFASLSGDGSTAIVGGPFDNNNVGAAWVFTQPVFAGAPGKPNCISKSVSALAQQYGGLAHAAAALGYSSINALQIAIADYCGR
jgi:hypothetical protein